MKFRIFIGILKTLLPPVISVIYLTFCWVVQKRTVLVPRSPFELENRGVIKSGITTISILVILIALQPIKNLIVDLKAEEFIRLLKSSKDEKRRGSGCVDLATANSLSLSPLGTFTALLIIIKRKCSLHFAVAVGSGFIVMVISALAPAALSVQIITLEYVDVLPLYVGAVSPESVAIRNDSISPLPPMYQRYTLTPEMRGKLQDAVSITWAEIAMNMTYTWSLQYTYPRYLFYLSVVPFPLDFPLEFSTLWVTDALALDPICSWQSNTTESSSFEYLEDGTIIFYDRSRGIAFNLDSIGTVNNESYVFEIHYASVALNGRFTIWDTSTSDVPSGGYSVWAIVERTSTESSPLIVDMTSVPTFGIDSVRFAILICSPGFEIETVEVRNEGSNLFVTPVPQVVPQHTLDQRQVELFFTALFCELSRESPKIPGLPSGVGSQIQASLIFGPDQIRWFTDENYSSDHMKWVPADAEYITWIYRTYLLSATKPFMSGALGTAEVPEIISVQVLAFVASRGYVIASTVLLIALNAINIWAYFRSCKGEVFGLFMAAGVLHSSNMPEEVRWFMENHAGLKPEDMEHEFQEESKNHFITLDHRDNVDERGVLVLHDASTYPLS
ncbi:hypothetical protein AX16_011035 [Volvariella volvacea WC 439]|nr:hypothetical protein AX16_011035 [Volvariella volvacea WC 439]